MGSKLHVRGPGTRYDSLARNRIPAGQVVGMDKCRCSIKCRGCLNRTVIIEDQYVGGVRYGNSGRTTWHGIHWWQTSGASTFDPAVPPPIAAAYDEALRCLSAGAPNGAAALLRNALALIVADKGTESAK